MNSEKRTRQPNAMFPMHPKMDEQLAQAFSANEDEEEKHIQKVQNAFLYYGPYACQRLKRSMDYLNSLSGEDQHMLSKYRAHLSCVRTCIDRNQAVIREILRERVLYPDPDSGSPSNPSSDRWEFDEPPPHVRHGDMDQNSIALDDADVEPLKILKAQSTLKLIARDWSTDGALEREQSYKPIIDCIVEYFKPSDYELKEIKILVPGAGLGRLTYELACLGYSCEGNEFSYFMLIASNFVLNLCDYENKYVLYPWVHQYVNNLRREDQVAAVRFPDVCPLKNPPKGHFEIAAGDFLEVYKTPHTYNCVATCFFIDCANNVIDFIRTIYKILVPGGIWVNLGPLLYHYSDVSGQNSIEPTFEDLCIIMESIGFVIESSRTGIRTKYAQNPSSMKQSEYQSLFWVCRKPDPFEEQRGKRKASREPHDLIVRADTDEEEEEERERAKQEQQELADAAINNETEMQDLAQPT
ncbi:carnosine N-methyltransferase isoform X1 [Drosophila bipectinata]|uniref:carnosine N-methyltransferase isoform X1 n=1 Tax=Drosophila bipectinata TaxID=42026 RepID=UPI001C8A18AE|nr:carnosine N-methyltransferase isoform X1 [Drosophila bipectinata]